MPVMVGRAKSLKACAAALAHDGRMLLVAQRNSGVEEPSAQDLYGIGVIATLVQHLPLTDGRMKLLVRGERRARIATFPADPFGLAALAEPIDAPGGQAPPPGLPDFSLADWAIDAGTFLLNRVGKLQHILEDDAQTPAERLHALRILIGGG
jgi:hypothetical protein